MTLKDLIIPLFTVLVVILQSLFNLVSKWIDVTQKKADHNQELRKIYFTRKVEAAEAVIGRWTVQMALLNEIRIDFAVYDIARPKKEDDNIEMENMKKHQQITKEMKGLHMSEKYSYYSYFDDGVRGTGVDDASQVYGEKMSNLFDLMNHRFDVDFLKKEGKIHNESEYNRALDDLKKLYAESLGEFNQAHDALINSLKKASASIRKELAV